MMTKPVVSNRIVEKRKNWDIFQDLQDRNDILDEAICILDSLKVLIFELPDKLTCSGEQADSMAESVVNLDSFLEKCLESTGLYFDEIEGKLDEMQKILLHDEVLSDHYSNLVTEVRNRQKLVDTVIGNAEEEIYRFLETEDLWSERRKTDTRIMELVLNF